MGVIFVFVLVILVGVVVIRTNWKKTVTVRHDPSSKTVTSITETFYSSHCWNCKKTIDSRWNPKCSKCRKYYLCLGCGKCHCERQAISSSRVEGKREWRSAGYYSTSKNGNASTSYNSTNKEDEKLGYGYCNECGKKLRGDRSKSLCYACYTS